MGGTPQRWPGRLGFIAGLLLLLQLGAALGYTAVFSRSDMPEDTYLLRYEDVEEEYTRATVQFQSGGEWLCGYIYAPGGRPGDTPGGVTGSVPGAGAKGLVVLSHGLGSYAESYLAETLFFVDAGWMVFAYDGTGSGRSGGAGTVGISASLQDLRAALCFLQGVESMAGLPTVLYGHSWGGWAVAAALAEGFDIAAVASVAGFESPYDALKDVAASRAGLIGRVAAPFVWAWHCLLFGPDANISAVEAINQTAVPVMVIHGSEDASLRLEGCSILARQQDITNENAVFVLRSGRGQNGHADLMRSTNANLYLQLLELEWDALQKQNNGRVPADARQAFYAGVDKAAASALDEALFYQIEDFFADAVR